MKTYWKLLIPVRRLIHRKDGDEVFIEKEILEQTAKATLEKVKKDLREETGKLIEKVIFDENVKNMELQENMVQEAQKEKLQDLNESSVTPIIYEPLSEELSFKGGLSACNYKCITSYCNPPDQAKGISTKNPHQPNSKIGHT